MRRAPRATKICTFCEEISEIGDSMKDSSSRMKNKVGAQKGAFIKMKQENIYTYQWLCGLCYVPIIAPSTKSNTYVISPVAFDPVLAHLNKPGLKRKRLKWPWSLRRTNTFDLPFQNQKFLGRNLSPVSLHRCTINEQYL